MFIPLKRGLTLIASLLILGGWGTKEDDVTSVAGGGKKPSVNFYGTIIDNTETAVSAQYITIGGKYKQFECYPIPKDLGKKDYNPADNIARLDLAEIAQINIPDPEKTYLFSGRSYLEIQVVSNDQQTVNTYMIESGKKIYFDEINESGPIERELVLSAVKQITIEGYTAAQPEKQPLNDAVYAQAIPLVPSSHHINDLEQKPYRYNISNDALIEDCAGL